jgi:HSP20 family protein
MQLIRYKTSAPYIPAFSHSSLLDEMDRLFEVGFPALARGGTGNYGAFPIDLYQDKEGVIVRSELPGFRKEDLHVQVADDTLTISGHLAAGDQKEKDTVQTETAVERAISLPENLDYEKVSAHYENGVLTVRLPKREETKPKTVAVEVK